MSLVDNRATGKDWNTYDRRGGTPYMHSRKKSYAGLIILLLFVAAMAYGLSTIWEPNAPPPEMNKKHRTK